MTAHFNCIELKCTYYNIEHELPHVQVTGSVYITMVEYVEDFSLVQLLVRIPNKSLQ